MLVSPVILPEKEDDGGANAVDELVVGYSKGIKRRAPSLGSGRSPTNRHLNA
jgi:hypothetical protein